MLWWSGHKYCNSKSSLNHAWWLNSAKFHKLTQVYRPHRPESGPLLAHYRTCKRWIGCSNIFLIFVKTPSMENIPAQKAFDAHVHEWATLSLFRAIPWHLFVAQTLAKLLFLGWYSCADSSIFLEKLAPDSLRPPTVQMIKHCVIYIYEN